MQCRHKVEFAYCFFEDEALVCGVEQEQFVDGSIKLLQHWMEKGCLSAAMLQQQLWQQL